ncbi:MAG: protein BatD [Bacteroidales bacterium]|nr:protein BatD [Bacteroidales bacterium]
MKSRILASVIVVLLCSGLLAAQDKTFTATAPAVVRAGEQFQYVIEGSEQGEVILPSLADFQLLAGPFSSYSSHSQWINGKMTMKTVVSYTHILRARKEGSFTIPPATVKVGRKEYKSNEVQIVVNPGNQPVPSQGPGQPGNSGQPGDVDNVPGAVSADDNAVFLRVIPSKKKVYVGEQFVSGLKVYTRVNTRPASSAKAIPYEGFYKKSLDPDANATRQDIGGQQYISQVIQRHILIPQKSGEITIEPYESEWMIQQRVQRRTSSNIFDDFFDDPFFNSYQDVPTKLATRPVTIHVKPLPSGTPAGFTGGVGDFSMNTSLSADEIGVNEALSLKITISGTGNLPLLGDPIVYLPPDHDLYDVTRSVNTSISENRISGSVSFEYPIVARHAGKFRIAPVVFAWFDPVSELYRTATSEEFTFTVLKGDNEEGAATVFVPGVMHENVKDIGTDIRDIVRTTPIFTPLTRTLLGSRLYRWMYPVVALLVIIIVIMIRIVARRNADLKLVRNRQASRSARNRLKKADKFRKENDPDGFYEEIGKAIWGYLSDKLAMETSGLSRDAILQDLENRKVPEEVRIEFLRILNDSEFSRFAPSSEKSEVNQLYRDAVTLIKNLENSL